MPYDSTGLYTNVAGATTAVTGQVVQSATWNNIHTDLGTALTMAMEQLISIPVFRNALYMNGGMEIWQRGAGGSASIAVAATTIAYTADRWYLATGANQASVVSAIVGINVNNKSQLAGQIQRNAAQAGATAMVFAYPLSLDEVLRLCGSKVSFTCLVKAGANWSPTNGTLSVILYVGTGAAQKRNATPYTGETTVLSISTNLTSGGALITITGSSSVIVPITSTQAELQITWTPTGAAGANDYFQLDDVQLEAQLSASTWTPTTFDRLPFASALQLCQRHYCKTFAYTIAPAQGVSLFGAVGFTAGAVARGGILWSFPQTLRITPDITTYNPASANANFRNLTSASDLNASVDPNSTLSDGQVFVLCATVTAVDNNVYIHITASAGL